MSLPVRKKIQFSIITVLLFGLIVEGSLRVAGYQFQYSEAAGLPDWVRFNINRWFLEYDNHLLWRVRRPNPDFHINDQGFRGDFISLKKMPFEYRILCLGDSCTWGHGVKWDEAYPVQLEKLLNDVSLGNFYFRTINAGVPGYSSFQSSKYYEKYLMKYSPDLVIVYLGRNDCRILPDQWGGHQDKDHIQSTHESIHLLLWVKKLKVYQLMSQGIFQFKKWTHLLKPAPAEVPLGKNEKLLPDDHRRVSTDDFILNIRKIEETAVSKHSKVLLLTSPVYPSNTGNYNDVIRSISKGFNYPLLDIEKIFRELGTRRLLLDDCHPTPEGHHIIAKEIQNLIPRLVVEN